MQHISRLLRFRTIQCNPTFITEQIEHAPAAIVLRNSCRGIWLISDIMLKQTDMITRRRGHPPRRSGTVLGAFETWQDSP